MSIALVTGSTRGIGLAAARRLARDCGHVILTGRDVAAGERAVDRILREGRSAAFVPMDVTDHVSVAAAARSVAREHGHLDVLVNNAGILPEGRGDVSAEVVDLALFRETFATNLLGTVGVLQEFLPLLRKSDAGRIVNVSTTMGSLRDQTDPDSPYFGLVVPAYQASKAALNSVTIGLSKLLADTTIKVTSVCPGFVRTDLAPAAKDAPLAPEDSAEVIYRAATLPATAQSGTFVDAAGAVPW